MNLSDPWDIPDRAIDPEDTLTPDEIDAEYDRLRDEAFLGIPRSQSLKTLWDAELPALLKRQAG